MIFYRRLYMIALEKAKRPLKGDVFVPGDKSISHRTIMFGAIANGTTEITGFLESADCLSTIDCFRKMGIIIEAFQRSSCYHSAWQGT